MNGRPGQGASLTFAEVSYALTATASRSLASAAQ